MFVCLSASVFVYGHVSAGADGDQKMKELILLGLSYKWGPWLRRWPLSLDSLQEQQVLLTTEPFCFVLHF